MCVKYACYVCVCARAITHTHTHTHVQFKQYFEIETTTIFIKYYNIYFQQNIIKYY